MDVVDALVVNRMLRMLLYSLCNLYAARLYSKALDSGDGSAVSCCSMHERPAGDGTVVSAAVLGDRSGVCGPRAGVRPLRQPVVRSSRVVIGVELF